MDAIDEGENVFHVVNIGEKEDMLPCFESELHPEIILCMGNIDEFRWKLRSNYGIALGVLNDNDRTDRLIAAMHEYMKDNLQCPVVSELCAILEKI